MGKKVLIDEDVLNFLITHAYSSSYTEYYKEAANTAYSTFKRTLTLKHVSNGKRVWLREKVSDIIKDSINEVLEKEYDGTLTQDIFDDWHRELCKKIIKIYNDELIDFTYGQAQKWVNMTFKHVYTITDILNMYIINDIIKYCHVPIDNYVLDYIDKTFGIKKPKLAWSNWDNYEDYLSIQKMIRKEIKGESPFEWEFREWNSLR